MNTTTLLPAESAELKAHAERAAKARAEGMQLLRDRRTNEYFATSRTKPGTLHRVTLASCDCLGFVRHQHCRHHSALVMAHLLQELGSTPAPSGPESTPTTESDVRTSSGKRIGVVKTVGRLTQAWGFGPEGLPLLVEEYRSTGTDAFNRAADRLHRFYETSHWAAPEERVYHPRTAA